MNGKVFIYVNNLVNTITAKSGIQVEVYKVTKFIFDKLLNDNKYSEEEILNGRADMEIKNILKNNFNINYEEDVIVSKPIDIVSNEDNRKDNNTFSKDFFDSIKIVNSKDKYISEYAKISIVNPNDVNEIVEIIGDKYTKEEVLQGNANREIDNLVNYFNLKFNSTKNKTNRIIQERKKAKNKDVVFKRILAFALAGTMLINVASFIKKQHGKQEFIDTFDERISAEINSNDPEVQNIFYTSEDNPDIITKNSKPVYVDNNIYTDYVESKIADDIKIVIKKYPQALNSMLIYTFSHMHVDLESALKSMDEVLRELDINEDFLTFIINNLENPTERMKEAAKSYRTSGLNKDNKDEIKKLVNAYLKTKYAEYQETYATGQEWSENLNGPSKS